MTPTRDMLACLRAAPPRAIVDPLVVWRCRRAGLLNRAGLLTVKAARVLASSHGRKVA